MFTRGHPVTGARANVGLAKSTSMLFFNSVAPIGWTKQLTHNDKAIRLTTGTPSTGGSVGFTTAFANGNTGNHTLTTAELPSVTVSMNSSTPTEVAHTHTVPVSSSTGGGTNDLVRGNGPAGTAETTSSVAATINAFTPTAIAFGSGSAHNHPLTLAVNYVDAIICNKD